MSDFTAKVVAQLDTSKIPSQLSQIESMISKRKFVIQVDTSAAKDINHLKSAYSDLLSLQQRINSTRVKLAGLDANKDKAQISALSGQLNRLMTDYNNLYATVGRKLSTSQIDNLAKGFDNATAKISLLNAKAADTKGVEKLERSFARLQDIVAQMGKIQLKIGGLDASKNANEIAQLISQYQNLESQYNRLKASLSGKLSGVQAAQLGNSLKEIQNQLAQLDAKAQDTKAKLANAINVKVSDGSLTASISKVTQEYERLATTGHAKLTEVKADIESLKQLQANLSNAKDVNTLIANYDKFNATLKKVKNGLSTISSESKTFASSLQITTLDNKIVAWMEKNTRAAKVYGNSLDELRAKLAALAGSGTPVPVSSVNEIEREFAAIQQGAIASGNVGSTFGATLKSSFKSISKYITASTIIYTAIRGLKDMYQNVANIDSKMIELKKVTDETDETYDRFLSGTNKKAQEIGTTITGLISSTADFARLGYSMEESEKLAEVANIYAVVGDDVADVDVATKSIISTMKAFGIETNNAMTIVDKFNEVGNHFAISSGGIGEAMQRSASAMNAANNTIDETIALITAANTVSQDPDSVGTAFKTLSMRIRGAKTDLEEAGLETDGMASSVSKLRDDLKKLTGIDLMKDGTTFKSTYQFLDELSQVWDKLSDVDQANVLEKIAGKRQANIVANLMKNFDIARDALQVSLGSEGSALREHEKWLDSVEAKQLQLKAAWEGLSKDFLSAGFVKGAVDFLRVLVNGIDTVVNKIGSLGTVLSGAGIFGLSKLFKAQGFVAGFKTLLGVVTKLPPQLLLVAAAVAAVSVAVYAINKHNYNQKFKWAEGMGKSAEEIKKYSDELVKFNKLSKEVKDLKLIINHPNSSKEEVENAQTRLQEIADILKKDYNLNITANADSLEETLNLLTQQSRGEMVDSAKDYIEKVEKNSEKYKAAKSTYKDDEARLAKIQNLYASYQELQSQYSLIDWFDEDNVDANLAKAQKIYDKWGKLHKTAVELGVNDTEKGVIHWEELQGTSLDEMSENDYYTAFFAEMQKIQAAFNDGSKQLPDIANSIQEFEESSQKASKYLAQALASDVSVNNTYGADTDIMLIEKLAGALQKAGKSTDGVAKDFAMAKQGFTDLNSAIEAGKLNDVIQEYIRFSEKFGESSKDIVRNTALLKQGFTDASQVTSESVAAIYNDMKELGKNKGISDYVKNAIQDTALLAAGFNTVEEATDKGATGVNAVLAKIKEIGDIDNYWEGLSNDEIARKITDIAHSMDLLPKNYVVTMDAEGNLNGFLKDAQACAEYLKEIGKTKVDFDFNTANLDNVNKQIEEAKRVLDSFKNEDGTINLSAEGAVEAQTVLANLLSLKNSLSDQPAVMSVDVSQVDGELSAAIQAIQNFQNSMSEFEIKTAIGADTSGIQSVIQNEISTINNLSPEVKAKLGLNTSDFENAVSSLSSTEIDVNAGVNLDAASLETVKSTISGITPEILVRAGVDDTLVKGYTPEDKKAVVTYSCVHTDVDNYNPPNLVRTVTYKKVEEGGGKADGTAHARGTALKSGYWGAKESDIALGGELGEELVVRNGKYFTIGADSAEFFAYKKGDIIFNAEQTKQILENGKITHGVRRGKAFAHGSDSKEQKEHFDWIETFSDRAERSITSLTNKFKSSYLTLVNRFTNLGQLLEETQKQISFKQQAYDRYISQANAVGLDESWAAKIRNGELDISTVTDDTLKEKIKDYKEWYEKALDCKDAIEELHQSVADFYKDNFDNIETAYDKILTSIEHKANLINTYIDRSEQKGLMGSTRYYSALQKIETETLQQLEFKRTDLVNALNDALNSGEIEEYSETWYDLQNSIDEVTEAIEESKNALVDYDNKMREISWDRFDYLQNRTSNFGDEADFLLSLLGDDLYVNNSPENAKKISEIINAMQENSQSWYSASSTKRRSLANANTTKAKDIADITGEDVYRDGNGVWWIGNQELYSYRNGQLNSSGMAAMGLHGLKYNLYSKQALTYQNEISRINSEIAENPYDTNLIARKQELLELQRKSILAAKEEKEAVIDLAKGGFDVELDSLKELISTYKTSLDSAKDLYEYQKKIKEHTKDIASIEKQLAAYENDTSEETKAKVQKLKADLEDAKNGLYDTEYDKYISDQKDLIDSVYEDYETLINERLDNIDETFEDLIDDVNSNTTSINKTLTQETSNVGTTLSNEMQSVWSSQSEAIDKYFGTNGIVLNNLTGYFQNTDESLSGINSAITTIMSDVNDIVQYASAMAHIDTDPESAKSKMVQNSLDWWATSDDATRNSLAKENEAYGAAFGYTKKDGSWYDSNGNLVYSVTDDEKIRNVINKMKANSAAWSGVSGAERKKLEAANRTYAAKIASLTGQSVYIDGDGVWWIGDKQLYSYQKGGLVNSTGMAWLDGTKDKPELVLNARDTENFIALKETLSKLRSQKLSYGSGSYSALGAAIGVSGLTDVSSMLSMIRHSGNNINSRSVGDININIPIDHVEDYNDFVSQLQKDKQFEKLIRSVSVDLLSGNGSSLAKNKYKWN